MTSYMIQLYNQRLVRYPWYNRLADRTDANMFTATHERRTNVDIKKLPNSKIRWTSDTGFEILTAVALSYVLAFRCVYTQLGS